MWKFGMAGSCWLGIRAKAVFLWFSWYHFWSDEGLASRTSYHQCVFMESDGLWHKTTRLSEFLRKKACPDEHVQLQNLKLILVTTTFFYFSLVSFFSCSKLGLAVFEVSFGNFGSTCLFWFEGRIWRSICLGMSFSVNVQIFSLEEVMFHLVTLAARSPKPRYSSVYFVGGAILMFDSTCCVHVPVSWISVNNVQRIFLLGLTLTCPVWIFLQVILVIGQ